MNNRCIHHSLDPITCKACNKPKQEVIFKNYVNDRLTENYRDNPMGYLKSHRKDIKSLKI